MRTVSFPTRGETNTARYAEMPPGFAPKGSLLNVRPFFEPGGRLTGGTRQRLALAFPSALGTGEIQAGICVSVPSVRELVPDACTPIETITQGTSTAATGNLWMLDSDGGYAWEAFVDSTASGGPGTEDVVACCFSKDGTKTISCINYVHSSGDTRVLVQCRSTTDGSLLWSHTISESGVNRFANAVCCCSYLVFVCTNQYVRVLHLSDGTQVGTDVGASGSAGSGNMHGWASECVEAGVASLTTTRTVFGFPVTTTDEYLFVAFNGSYAAGTVTGPTGDSITESTQKVIVAGEIAQAFRSGVMKFIITSETETGPFATGFNLLTRVSDWAPQLASSDPFFEANHFYFRISENSGAKPHGPYITAMRVHTDGSCYVVRTNQGWGPTGYFRPTPNWTDPDGSTGFPFYSVMKIGPTGTLSWENNNAASITDVVGYGSYAGNDHYNDIAYGGTFRAIALDASGNCYVAGRQNSAGLSVYALSANSGLRRWSQNVMDATTRVRDAAIAVDDTRGLVWIGGDRNSGWTGASGSNANLWALSLLNGSIVNWLDFGAYPSTSSVATSAGNVLYGTEKL